MTYIIERSARTEREREERENSVGERDRSVRPEREGGGQRKK